MREIKFRVWDGNRIYTWGELLGDEFTTEQLFTPDVPTWTLMQYTGLKDKNGKEIYEGDIVKIWSEIMPEWAEGIHKVEWWDEGKWSLGFRDARTLWEVIGNIYENPELLESN